MTQPWHREVGEPARWYARFKMFYLVQGTDRTIEQAYRLWLEDSAKNLKSQRPTKQWSTMSRLWRWKERALAWDQSLTDQVLEKTEKERLEMQERLVKTGLGLQNAAVQRLQKILGDPDNGDPGEWETLTVKEMLALLEKGFALEGRGRGLPDGTFDLTSGGKPIGPISITNILAIKPDDIDEPDDDTEDPEPDPPQS